MLIVSILALTTSSAVLAQDAPDDGRLGSGALEVAASASQAPEAADTAETGATEPPPEAKAPAISSHSKFEEFLDGIFETINGYIEAALFFSITGKKHQVPFVVAVLVLGSIFFTFWFGWINIRGFKHALALIRGKYDNPDDQGEISHFQALTSALSATVGLGNIAGVALAVTIGGPGAVFWMIFLALFGMSVKFSSCTLAQLFRKTNADGSISGGPMYYLDLGIGEKGAAWRVLGKALAIMFALMCIGGALGGGNMFQANQSFEAFAEASKIPLGYVHPDTGERVANPWPARVYGVVMAALVGAVILGGIKRIGGATSRIVPLMCVTYVIGSLIIIFTNVEKVPDLLVLICTEAFTAQAGYGGFIGVMVWGFTRAAFSNEAGLGSAAIAHSAAKTNEPVREGLVAMLGPFIDTIIICLMTALVVLITGAYLSPSLVVGDQPQFIRQAEITSVTIQPLRDADETGIDTASVRLNLGHDGNVAKEMKFLIFRAGRPVNVAVIRKVQSESSVATMDLEEALARDGSSYTPKQYTNLPKKGDRAAAGEKLVGDIPGILIQAKVRDVKKQNGESVARLDVGRKDGVVKKMTFYVHDGSTFHGSLTVTDVDREHCDARVVSDLMPSVGDLALTARTTKKGAAVTMHAFRSLNDWFPIVLSACIILFAFSTMISWCYYGERAWIYLFGLRSLFIFRIIFVVFVFLGSVLKLGNVLGFSDLMILCMAFPNIVGSIILAPYVKRKVNDYWSRYKSGEMKPIQSP